MTQRSNRSKSDWPPAWARLPDDFDEIEFGPIVQRGLFDNLVNDPIDDSREGRLARLFGSGSDRKPGGRKFPREGR